MEDALIVVGILVLVLALPIAIILVFTPPEITVGFVLRAFERDWFVEPTLQTGSLSPHSLMFRYRKNIYVISYARIDDCDEILRVVLRCDKDGGVDGSHTEDLLIAFRDGESTHLDRQRHIRFSKELLRLVKEKLDIS